MTLTPEQEKTLESLLHNLTFVKGGEGEMIDNWWNDYIARMIIATAPKLTVDEGAYLIKLEYLRRYYDKKSNEFTRLFKQ